MNILVTGATGFIGRHLVKKLSQSQDNIICLVRNKKKAKLLEPLGVKFIFADINQVIRPGDIDIIFHCAGYVKNNNKDSLYKVNVLGTDNICKLALSLNVKRMVHVSSVAVVSGHDQLPLVEGLPFKVTNSISIYGESKIEAEKRVLYYREKGLRAVIIRPPMVYGEDEPHLLKLLLLMLKYRLMPLINQGKNKMHLVYVENVVDSMFYSLGKEEFLDGSFFIADKEVLNLNEIMTVLSKAIGARLPWSMPALFNPVLLGMPYIGIRLSQAIKDRVYSIDRITGLGFRHAYSAESALMKSAQALMSDSGFCI